MNRLTLPIPAAYRVTEETILVNTEDCMGAYYHTVHDTLVIFDDETLLPIVMFVRVGGAKKAEELAKAKMTPPERNQS